MATKGPFSRFGNQPPPIPQMPKVALDRFGNIIEPGHLILYHAPTDLVFEVVAVHPVVNPSAQNGMAMQITMNAQFSVQGASGVPAQSLIIVGESQARVAEKAKNNGRVGQDRTAAPAEEQPPSALVLTDGPNEISDDVEEGVTCSACGDVASPVRAGQTCVECGSGTYQKA